MRARIDVDGMEVCTDSFHPRLLSLLLQLLSLTTSTTTATAITTTCVVTYLLNISVKNYLVNTKLERKGE